MSIKVLEIGKISVYLPNSNSDICIALIIILEFYFNQTTFRSMKSPLHGMMLVLTLLLSCQFAFSQTRQISGK
ncbi:hypothetical protein, partial [Haliscomenobacter sp.]|uniref:hypothetical protein n=1 Tax=Haliscomenobacter sp. TaxID=2717303 RepID=UPI003364F28B